MHAYSKGITQWVIVCLGYCFIDPFNDGVPGCLKRHRDYHQPFLFNLTQSKQGFRRTCGKDISISLLCFSFLSFPSVSATTPQVSLRDRWAHRRLAEDQSYMSRAYQSREEAHFSKLSARFKCWYLFQMDHANLSLGSRWKRLILCWMLC